MILLEAVVGGLIVALLTGGRLSGLQNERFRGEWLLLALLPAQLVWPNVAAILAVGRGVAVLVWLLMMSGLATVLLVNASRRWMLAFAGLGIALNILVIGLNGAMPVSIEAAESAGIPSARAVEVLKDDLVHEVLSARAVVPFLADVIAVPGPEWQRAVVSIGDLLLAAGLSLWAFAACTSDRRVPK